MKVNFYPLATGKPVYSMAKANAVETEPAVGQVYRQTRDGTQMQILYVDEQIVLLRVDEMRRNGMPVSRLERRSMFDTHVSSGFFEHQPDAEIDVLMDARSSWSDVPFIGEQTEQRLYEAGYDNVLDVRRADDTELLEVTGIGERSLKELREFAQ